MSSRGKKRRTRKRLWLLPVGGIVLLLLAIAVEPTRVVRGFLRGEPFFQGRPASYWRTIIREEFKSEEVPERLLSLTEESAFRVLARCMQDRDPNVRAMAVRLAAISANQPIASPSHVERVLEQLHASYQQDTDKRVRGEAIGGLSMLDRSATTRERFAQRSGEAILTNMPMNSDLRCVGIATVAEALLQAKKFGQPSQAVTVTTLSQLISANWTSGRTLAYPARVQIDSATVNVDSQQALNEISTAVTNIYKKRHEELSATESGRNQLLAASRQFLKSSRQLATILDTDADNTVVFCGIGRRYFSNGNVTDTYHAFLIRKMNDGRRVIFDPNDPGSPIPCKIDETADGVTVEWRCRYRDTGQVTRQKYQLVHGADYFKAVFGTKSAADKS